MNQPELPETKNWRFHVDVESLGWLTINVPGAPVNTLNREALAELEELWTRIEELIAGGEVAGVILLLGAGLIRGGRLLRG